MLETVSGEEVSGELFAHDKQANMLLLRQKGSTPFHHHLQLLRKSQIKGVISSEPPALPLAAAPLPYVDPQRSQDRLSRALQTAQSEADKIGQGVTPQGQFIFDTLVKTMPCKWQGQSIVVLGEVTISAPYQPQDCHTKHPDDTTTLDRVVKVLQHARQTLDYA